MQTSPLPPAPADLHPTLTERLARQRQDRHDTAVQDLHLALASVRQALEASVTGAIATLKSAWTPEAEALTAAILALEARPPADTNAEAVECDDAWVALYRRAGAVTGLVARYEAALAAGEQAHRVALARTLQEHHVVLSAVAHELPAGTDRLVLAEGVRATRGVLDTRRAAAMVRADLAAYALRLQGRIAAGRAVNLRQISAAVSARVARELMTTLATIVPPRAPPALALAAPLLVLADLREQAAVGLVPPPGAGAWAGWQDTLRTTTRALAQHAEAAAATARRNLAASEPVVALAVASAQSRLFVLEPLVDGDFAVAAGAPETSGPGPEPIVDAMGLQALADAYMAEAARAVDAYTADLHAAAEGATAPLTAVSEWLGPAMRVWHEHAAAIDARKTALAAALDAIQHRGEDGRANLERQIGLAVDALRQAGTPEDLRSRWATVSALLDQNNAAHATQQSSQRALLPAYPHDVGRLVSAYANGVQSQLASPRVDKVRAACEGVVSAWQAHIGPDGWPAAAAVAAAQHIECLEAGLADERALYQSVHAARWRHLERDVHNVRAAELVLHRERVTQHGKGLEAGLVDLKARFGVAPLDGTAAAAFAATVRALEEQLAGMSPDQSATLQGLQTRLKTTVDAYCADVRQSLRATRGVMGAALHELRASNGALRTSLRTFAEGGNFSAEEVTAYSSVVQALAAHIDTAEGVLLGTLEGAEAAAVKDAHATLARLSAVMATAVRDATLLTAKASAARRLHLAVLAQSALVDRQAAAVDRALAAVVGPSGPTPGKTGKMAKVGAGSAGDTMIDGAQALVTAMETHAAFLGASWGGFSKAAPSQAGESINRRLSMATSLIVPGQPKVSTSTSSSQLSSLAAGSRRLQPRPPGGTAPLPPPPGNKFVARASDEPHVVAPWLATLPGFDAMPRENRAAVIGATAEEPGEAAAAVAVDADAAVSAGYWLPIVVAAHDALAALLVAAGPYYDALRGKAPACGASVLEETLTRFVDARQMELRAEVARAAANQEKARDALRANLRAAAEMLQARAPGVLMAVLSQAAAATDATVGQAGAKLAATLQPLKAANAALFAKLRPNLGHPNNAAQLQQLVTEESAARAQQEAVLHKASDEAKAVATAAATHLADHERLTESLARVALRLSALFVALDPAAGASNEVDGPEAAAVATAARATAAERLAAHVLGQDCATVVATREARDVAVLGGLAAQLRAAGREARAAAGGGGSRLTRAAEQAQVQVEAAAAALHANHTAWDRAVAALRQT